MFTCLLDGKSTVNCPTDGRDENTDAIVRITLIGDDFELASIPTVLVDNNPCFDVQVSSIELVCVVVIPCVNSSISSDAQLTCILPEGTGTGRSVTVQQTTDGLSVQSPPAFLLSYAEPTVTTVTSENQPSWYHTDSGVCVC